MKAEKIICLIIAVAFILILTGCASMIEGEVLDISPHEDNAEPAKTEKSYVEVETYGELYDAVHFIVESHVEKGYIKATNYYGNIDADVEKACLKIYNDDPLGAYALYYISGTVNRIVSYYEVEIDATYNHSQEQINSLRNASSKRYFYNELLDIMTEHSSYCAIYTDVEAISADDIKAYVNEAYYSNPLKIVRKPLVSVNMFPNEGAERIVEVKFDYLDPALTAEDMKDELQKSVRKIAGAISDESDEYVVLDLTERLVDNTEPDIVSAIPGTYTEQDISTTAYGALVEKKAVGEGYAMAYKALCDEMNIECAVVTGRKNNVPHSWNIVKLGSSHYHIDNYICDTQGIEKGFLMSDADMGDYWWDTLQFSPCSGTLTYSRLVEPETAETETEDTQP